MRHLLLSIPFALLAGCSVQSVPEAPEVKARVCVEELSCKEELAKDCPNGGVLHRATPAVLLHYSCNP